MPRPNKHNGTVQITRCDIPYTIVKSGVYELVDSIVYTDETPAISVRADGVTLFGKGNTINLANQGLQAINVTDVDDVIVDDFIIRNGNVAVIDPIIIPPFTPLSSFPDIRAAGVKVVNGNNIIVRNLLIDNVLYGVVAGPVAGNITIENIQLARFGVITNISGTVQPVGSGVVVSGANPANLAKDIKIRNVHAASETAFNGVFINQCDGFNIQNSYAASGRRNVPGVNFGAFCVTDSRSGLLKNVDSRFATQTVFVLRGTGVDLDGVHATGTNQDGIEVTLSKYCTVRNSTIHRVINDEAAATPGSGIKFNVVDYGTIDNNVISGFNVGTNPADNNGSGIVLAACNSSIIQNNAVNGNSFGIKEILTFTAGPMQFQGTPSVYYKNTSAFNTIEYQNIGLVANTTTSGVNTVLVNPYVNIAPNLP